MGGVWGVWGRTPKSLKIMQDLLTFKPILIKLIFLIRGVELCSDNKNMIKLAA